MMLANDDLPLLGGRRRVRFLRAPEASRVNVQFPATDQVTTDMRPGVSIPQHRSQAKFELVVPEASSRV